MVKWKSLRSTSLIILCMAMASEIFTALLDFALQSVHLYTYSNHINEMEWNPRTCFNIFGAQIFTLSLSEISSLMVSVDRLYLFVAPIHYKQKHLACRYFMVTVPLIAAFTLYLPFQMVNIQYTNNGFCASINLTYEPDTLKLCQLILVTVNIVMVFNYVLILIILKFKYKKSSVNPLSTLNDESKNHFSGRTRYLKPIFL
uniref:G-protein coupled receptors family 1 profile domain-containing protein n=1 Tax=Romanomermis culicivorax TaxID=13658 RepID=A0A915IL25_ROMCU